MSRELRPDELRRTFEAALLGCDTTEGIPAADTIVGQERAVRALEFGLGIRSAGFNTYVAGPPGIGKMTAIRSYLEKLARGNHTPSDWVYVNDFDDTHQPRALKLPAGKGRELQSDMKALVEHVRTEIPKAFESGEYAEKREELVKELARERDSELSTLNDKVARSGFALQATPYGLVMAAVKDDKPLTDTELARLPDEEQERIAVARDELQGSLKKTMKTLRRFERTGRAKLRELDQRVTRFLVGGVVDDLIEKYGGIDAVTEYLRAVAADVVENIDSFKSADGGSEGIEATLARETSSAQLRRYQVNVLVDNSSTDGAPVIVELNPIYTNLFGRIEKEAMSGSLYTDFTLIRPGSMHRANGGFLVIPIDDLLRDLFSWDGIKRALRSSTIEIEEIGERLGFTALRSLKPQPIPLDVKVILVGRPLYYYLLHHHDDEFAELFKVRADFESQMEANDANIHEFVQFVCALCTKEDLRHLDGEAVARLLEAAARLADDQRKVSTQFGAIADLIREADHWAGKGGAAVIGAAHVKRALDEKRYRASLLPERMREAIERRMILISTTGAVVGQVNGLAVLSLPSEAFGKPSRITATVAPGRKGVVDIEREVELGGPIHSKGVMILGGYLSAKYGGEGPLALDARLVFEQSYGGVDGDSASSVELYALLSALSELPIAQGIAATGSVNQRGEVQAIGGVNEKIEGFFEVCRQGGLDGTQGVMIPAANVEQLMLRDDVIEAVRGGQFHIWAVETIDEGIERLTGVAAGQADSSGAYPDETVHARVAARLAELRETLRAAAEAPNDKETEDTASD